MAAARAAGVPDFQLFGEVFIANAIDLVPFVRERGLPNLLDFPLQEAAAGFAGGDAGARGIASRLGDDDYFRLADGRAPVPPTFLGNHDMGRAALKIQERSHATGDALLRRTLLGHDLLYLLRGAPTVLYGDEVGLVGRGGDQQARQDLFPTQVEEWKTQPRIGSGPIGSGSSFDQSSASRGAAAAGAGGAAGRPPGALDRRNGRAPRAGERPRRQPLRRRGAARVRGGVQQRDERRRGSRSRPRRPGATWTRLLGTGTATGSLTLTIPRALERAAARRHDPSRAPGRRGRRSGSEPTRSPTSGACPGRAPAPPPSSFAVKRRQRAAGAASRVDDSPPFRAFLDAARFRRNERVHLVAIARGWDGSTSVSRVTPFVVRRR